MADGSTGLRRLPALGNAQKRLSWTVNLPAGTPVCYSTVQAIDTGFLGSPWATESIFANTSEAKAFADGIWVTSSGIVTAVFGDVFYIENEERISGIQVRKTSHGVAVGDRVSVAGEMQTDDGERYIAASDLSIAGTAAVPAPYFLNPNAVGGAALGLQLGVADWRLVKDPDTGVWSRQLVTLGGANNIGLLVKVTGRVSHPDSGSFYLNGTCPFDDSDEAIRGIEVAWPFAEPMPADGAFVQMNAISSCTVRGGQVVRLLRPVSPSAVEAVATD